MLIVYYVLLTLALPIVLVRLWLKGRNEPLYRQHWRQRFGFVPRMKQPVVWLHAVSYGESVAASPLITRLLAENIPVLVTNTTATGRGFIEREFGSRLTHAYLPYDLPIIWRIFFNRVQVKCLILIETELWPGMIASCERRAIPIVFANARMSERSAERYLRYSMLSRPMFKRLTAIAAQTEADRTRLIRLGACPERITVTGSIKFDLQPPKDLSDAREKLQAQLGQRPIWVAASTHQGEEAIVLAQHSKILQQLPDALLIIAPRHPQRFDHVSQEIASSGFSCVRRSTGGLPTAKTQVYLADTMGELLLIYSVAQVAFIGGSFTVCGGHNPLEASLVGTPVLTGPGIENNSSTYHYLEQAGAAYIVADSDQLYHKLNSLLQNQAKARTMGAKGQEVVAKHCGACDRIWSLIAPICSDNL